MHLMYVFLLLCTYINVNPDGGGGVGEEKVGAGCSVGILTFLKKNSKIPTPGQKIIFKISRNKWFTSLLSKLKDQINA